MLCIKGDLRIFGCFIAKYLKCKANRMGALHIRIAEENDNEKILELASRCPQEGMITFYPDRKPRFNTLHRIVDPGAFHYVACDGDDIIGLIGVIHFETRILDKVRKIGYILDLKMLPAYRQGITSFRLVKTAVEHLQASDVEMVMVNFLKDNKRPMVFTSGRGGLPPACYLGDNRIFNMFPVRFMALDNRFVIEEPSEEDIPDMVSLLQRYADTFRIGPVVTEAVFRNYLSLEGLSLDHFLVARQDGRLRAMTACWDEHTYKSYNVLRLKPATTALVRLMRLVSLFWRMPRPVRMNEPLRQLSLVLFAHDNCPEALDTLFRHVNNIHLGGEYSMLTIYAQERDPMFRYLNKHYGVSIRSEMHLFAKDMTIFNKLKDTTQPALLDLVLTL